MNYRILNIQIILLLALAFPAIADENETQPKTEPEKSSSSSVTAADAQQKSDQEKSSGLTLAGVKDYLGLSVYLQGGYVYTVANTSNSFVLDMAELQLWHKPQIGEVGYKLKIMAGSTAEAIHSNGLGFNSNDVPFDLTEAYVTYIAPLGSGLTIQFGKFVTFTGAEVLEAKDNINYSYSFLFLDAIPFTHTGLMLSYTVAEIVTISGYALNGWDNTLDNNRAKTYGLSINIAPSQFFSALVNFLAGPEQKNNDSNWRYLVDVVLTAKPLTSLTLIVNADYAHEMVSTGNVSWHGADLIAKYDILSWLGLGGRIEYFNDRNGARTGFAQDLKEVTVTPEFRLPMSLVVRPEYRHDWSSKAFFNGNKSRDTLSVAILYPW